ncbi:GrpB family protein [Microbacterium sp.]|uniref:GrpB family protein n=1 Tax=Microbacterium sp. TaxID=51671 RepID=UPI0028119ED4|nr:GrpB family protein [Microbacterium sp.]
MTTHPLWRPFTPGANAARQAERVASRQTAPGAVQAHDEGWREQFEEISRVLTESIGDLALSIHHVGSTSVPGLAAKPVIDVDLTVPDVEDEHRYLPRLEAAGFRLIFRDVMSGDPHRQLTFARPNTNLHVWSPSAIEPQRHTVFTDWLKKNPTDRHRYNAAKAAASTADGTARYNDLKAAAVYDIYERAFIADPRHDHDPHPRPGRVAGAASGTSVPRTETDYGRLFRGDAAHLREYPTGS